MTATATAAAEMPRIAPLRPRPDQRERWMDHSRPLGFEEAAQLVMEAREDDGDRQDVVAHDLRTWAFGSTDGETMELVPVPFAGRRPVAPIAVRELAFGQLCHRIGAPASYIRELPAKLQMANVNWGLAREPRPALLRCAGGEARAVVSERYAALDDDLVFDVVRDVLDRAGYLGDARVRALGVGHHTVMRITLPGEGVPVRVGDVIEAGIDIANSEVGLRSVQVTPITYRLVCTNGMRAWRSEAALRMRHVGDPNRLHEQLRDAVPIAFAEARGDIARWQRATEVLVDHALEEVESLRLLGLSSGEVQAVGRELAVSSGRLLSEASGAETVAAALGAPTTAFEVANAITAVARDRDSIASRLSLEEAGHRYLSRRTA